MLRVYKGHDNSEYVVAESIPEANELWLKHMGEDASDYDSGDWMELRCEDTMMFHDDNEDGVSRRTSCKDLIAKYGKGYLCSENI